MDALHRAIKDARFIDLATAINEKEQLPPIGGSGLYSCFLGGHEDKSPSLSMQNDFFNCFSCGVKGDIFEYVMAIKGLPFGKAKEYLSSYVNADASGSGIESAVNEAFVSGNARSKDEWKSSLLKIETDLLNWLADLYCHDEEAQALIECCRVVCVDAIRVAGDMNPKTRSMQAHVLRGVSLTCESYKRWVKQALFSSALAHSPQTECASALEETYGDRGIRTLTLMDIKDTTKHLGKVGLGRLLDEYLEKIKLDSLRALGNMSEGRE